ncbi:MAG: OmpA family protein [Pseudomonadota bacterium]
MTHSYRTASLNPSRRLAPAFLLACLAPIALSACSSSDEETAPEEATEQVSEEVDDTVSILRPEIELPEAEPTPEAPEPYTATIGFPEGGRELNADAIAALEEALASPATPLGQPITLRAHSDSSGSDRANLRVSENRGLAVAQWLIDQGIDETRITVIAFGEQNPTEPNALPDGSPNEEGRAANRRVEIEIAASAPAAPESEVDAETPAPSNAEMSVETGD